MSVVESLANFFWSPLAYLLIQIVVAVVALFVWEFIYSSRKESSVYDRRYGTGGPEPLSPRYNSLPAYELARPIPSPSLGSVYDRIREERGE